MANVTSPDNLPFPEDGDSPDVPRDIFALADATQDAFNARHQYATQSRPGDASGPTGVPVPFTAPISISSAPAGVYYASFVGSVKRLPGDGSPVSLEMNINGTRLVEQSWERADTYWVGFCLSLAFVHEGGTVTLNGSAVGALNGVLVRGGTVGTLVRVG